MIGSLFNMHRFVLLSFSLYCPYLINTFHSLFSSHTDNVMYVSFLLFPFHRWANRKLASGAVLLGVVPAAAVLDAISITVEALPVDD